MSGGKRKINLLTFNSALSYGAVLQTYALIEVLEDLDYDVEIIDFRAPFLLPVPTGFWTLKVNYNYTRLRKEVLFYRFRKKYLNKKTRAIYSLRALKNFKFNADYYIVGSDQVWNPDITKKFALAYFFDFVAGKKISYAASFGNAALNYTDSYTEDIKKLLAAFKAISVRESKAAETLNTKFNLPARTVLDPTMLLRGFPALYEGNNRKKQIVVFKLQYDNDFFELVNLVQKELNMPAIALDTSLKYNEIQPIPFPTVEELVRHFAESSFIVTDSFHGVALSIIYRKDFIVINANPKRFLRIEDLLQKLGLQSRVINNRGELTSTKCWLEKIDYISVDARLNELRELSYDFIRESLS